MCPWPETALGERDVLLTIVSFYHTNKSEYYEYGYTKNTSATDKYHAEGDKNGGKGKERQILRNQNSAYLFCSNEIINFDSLSKTTGNCYKTKKQESIVLFKGLLLTYKEMVIMNTSMFLTSNQTKFCEIKN